MLIFQYSLLKSYIEASGLKQKRYQRKQEFQKLLFALYCKENESVKLVNMQEYARY